MLAILDSRRVLGLGRAMHSQGVSGWGWFEWNVDGETSGGE